MGSQLKMHAAVIGYGSIGQRHARILSELGLDVSIVSRRGKTTEIDEQTSLCMYENIQALFDRQIPDYIVIANETSAHLNTLRQLVELRYRNRLLIEKPLFHHSLTHQILETVKPPSSHLYTAYNLRFHPVLTALRSRLEGESIITAHIYAGQYLPDWRPQSDYRQSYSASASQGGGVIRDLSHELDYILWLFGDWNSLVAMGGKESLLQIDSDDHFSAIVKMERCPHLMLHLNYLERVPRRQIIVNTTTTTLTADLVVGTLTERDQMECFELERDLTYRLQHEDALSQQPQTICTFSEALNVLAMIEAMEHSARRKEWQYQ
jgi:predicted dehydrogenase